jgi:hypothetical protein
MKLGTAVTSYNSVQRKKKKKHNVGSVNSGNSLLPTTSEPYNFPFPTQTLKIKIYKNTILPVVIHGREILYLTPRKDG